MQFKVIFEWCNRQNCLDSVEVNMVHVNNIPVVVDKHVESIKNLGYKFSQIYLIPME